MGAPVYTSKSPAESRAIIRALEAGTPATKVVGHLLGHPEPEAPRVSARQVAAAPSRPRSAPAPLQRAGGAVSTVLGAPENIATGEPPSDSALSRLFAAIVVGALVLEIASLMAGRFFNIDVGPFPARVTTSATPANQVPRVIYQNPDVNPGKVPVVPGPGL